MPEQKDLIPIQYEMPILVDIDLGELPPDEELVGPSPSKKFIESVKRFGVIKPIVIQRYDELLAVGYKVHDGRNRIKASRILGLKTIPAFIYEASCEISTIGLDLNELNRDNPISDYETIAGLVEKGYTIDQVVKSTSLSKMTIEKRLLLKYLPDDLKEGVAAGVVAVSTAERLAKWPAERQERAIYRFRLTGKLTGSDLDGLMSVEKAHAVQALPDNMFGFSEDDPRQMAVVVAKMDGKNSAYKIPLEWVLNILVQVPPVDGAETEMLEKLLAL